MFLKLNEVLEAYKVASNGRSNEDNAAFWGVRDAFMAEVQRLQAVEQGVLTREKNAKEFKWEDEYFEGFGTYDSAYATYLIWSHVEQDYVLDYILEFIKDNPGERNDLWYIDLGALLEDHITYGQVFPEGADIVCDPSELQQDMIEATLKQVRWSELARKWTENLPHDTDAED